MLIEGQSRVSIDTWLLMPQLHLIKFFQVKPNRFYIWIYDCFLNKSLNEES